MAPDFDCGTSGCGVPSDDLEKAISGTQHATASAFGGFGGSGSATATTNYGTMHLYSQFTNAGGASAFGWFHDDVDIAPNLAPGTLVDVTFSILVEGSVLGTGTTTNGSGPELHKFCESGKPVSLPANMGQGCQSFSFKRTFLGAFVIDAACASALAATSSAVHGLVRGDYDINWNLGLPGGFVLVGPTLRIDLEVQAVHKA